MKVPTAHCAVVTPRPWSVTGVLHVGWTEPRERTDTPRAHTASVTAWNFFEKRGAQIPKQSTTMTKNVHVTRLTRNAKSDRKNTKHYDD